MKLGDIVDHVSIDPHKLTKYALNPEHPLGRHKAYVFERILGFTIHNYEVLLKQIERNVLFEESHQRRTDAYGNHYTVDLEVMGPEGQSATVRTGWIVSPNSDEARLTTLYVR